MHRSELEKIVHIKKRVDSRIRQLEDLRSTRYSLGAIDYSKDRVQTSKITAPQDIVIKIFDLEAEIQESIGAMVDQKHKVRECICAVPGLEGSVLEMRYLEGMEWKAIACELNYSVSGVKRIHERAIEEIEKSV